MSDKATPQPEPQQAEAPPVSGPGPRLREARERRGLSREEVAERLHLQATQVEALENDDYAHFPAPIFIRGHLHNYARLLGIDPDSVTTALEAQGLEQPPILSELTAAMPAARRRGISPRARAALFAVGTVLFLAALWLLLKPAEVSRGKTVLEERGEGDISTPAAAISPSVESAAAEAVPAQEPASAGTTPPDVAPDAPGEAPGEDPPPATNEPMDGLVLRFSGESWVEVADVTGRRMAYRMGNFPDVLHLRGLAPFDILLGNARNVTIEYNGEPYEKVPISRSNVASFRLGGPSDEGVKRNESQESD